MFGQLAQHMRRSLVQLGRTTLCVSLPHEFVQRYGLQKGDEIDVSEEEAQLVLNAQPAGNTSCVVNITDEHYSVAWYTITAAYMAGHATIDIQFETPHLKKSKEIPTNQAIAELTGSLIGMEVMEQGKNHCLLKEIALPKKDELPKLLSRIWNVLVVLANECRDPELRKIVHVHEDQLNKLVMYGMRLLSRAGAGTRQESLATYAILSRLEVVGDLFQQLLAELEDEGCLEQLEEVVRSSRDAFSTGDIAKAWHARHALQKVDNEIAKQISDNLMDALHLRLTYT
jgi:phosphate uptake regulator|tara:strand:+ start:209 stop:1063 length:855 start_codon:yes stop_codon:yes gene_type:complete